MDRDKTTQPDPGGQNRPRPLTTGQVATELGITGRHVLNLIQAGEITATQIGVGTRRHYRVTPWALRMYRERHQTGRRVSA